MSGPLYLSSRAQDARSRFESVAYLLREKARDGGEWERESAGREAAHLVSYVLSHAFSLVELLDVLDEDDFFAEEVRVTARALHVKVRNHHLARKMEQVNGRTPEEALAFQKKADELRGGVG